MNLGQIFENINIGLVVLDGNFRIQHWNRWMELHSRIAPEDIIGTCIFDRFPELENASFQRNLKSVLAFGNFCFFSQKLHHFLFPMKADPTLAHEFENMQQSCTMGPVRNPDGTVYAAYICVQDVTETVAYQRKLVAMNMTDGLTSIYNRRFLEKKLDEEWARYRRYGRPLSVIMFDIDHFKKFNDTYGHQCGDFVLQEIAGYVKESVRKTDYVCRYGGEEFVCILTETDHDAAKTLADRLREGIAEQVMTYESTEFSVTVSMGVAECGEGVNGPEDLIRTADAALYRAKEAGRNRVAGSRDVPADMG